MIELQRLSKRYDSTVAVHELSFEVEQGELVFLVGGSGSGKTTTLKMVNRLIEPSAGRILVDGEDVTEVPAWELRRRMGYVFQQIGLFPHLTVGRNIAISPRLLGWPEERIERRVDELLELVELPPGEYRDRSPDELSGGQAQRVALARALAAEPSVVLFDEPFGALDPGTRSRLQESFREIRHKLQLTGLFVTHDMAEALDLGDRVAVLDRGRLVQIGTPAELVAHPATEAVAEMLEAPRRQSEILARLAAEGAAKGPV